MLNLIQALVALVFTSFFVHSLQLLFFFFLSAEEVRQICRDALLNLAWHAGAAQNGGVSDAEVWVAKGNGSSFCGWPLSIMLSCVRKPPNSRFCTG